MQIKPVWSAAFAALPTLALLACGTTTPRQLESITLTPAAAGGSGAGVAFLATEHWTTSPTSVPAASPHWGVCQDNQPTSAVVVSASGVATCQKGAQGTYSVFAAEMPPTGPNCQALTPCGGGCQISGSAQLACP